MRRGRSEFRPAGLQQRLLNRTGRCRGQAGSSLLEWTIASALGLVISAAALLLFTEQVQLLRSMLLRHQQQQDLQAVMQVLRAEIRTAGQRHAPGASADHDAMVWVPTAPRALHYLCDRCGSPDRARQSSFRLLDGALAHRSLGAAAHQALNDPEVWRIGGWRVEQGHHTDCSPWARVVLESSRAGAGNASPIEFSIRPRNQGLLACEAVSPSAPAGPAAGVTGAP